MGLSDPKQQTLDMNRDTTIWYEKERLTELYHDRGLTLKEIAKKVGVSITTVHRKMKQAQVETNGPGIRTKKCTFRTNKEKGVEEASGSHETVKIHRLIMVAIHGVDAVACREVHHKNKIPFDNRPSNLQLLSKLDHIMIHNRIDSIDDRQTTLDTYQFL